MLDVLVIAPHPDDAEIGVGGSIVKMQRAGLQVGILDLTNGEPTPFGDPARRAAETQAATDVLQVAWRHNAGLTNRELQPTLAARAAVANVIRQTRPRLLIAPYWVDAHPDHLAAAQLVDDARFWAKLTRSQLVGEPFYPPRIYCYYALHLRPAIQPALVIDISDAFPAKLQAVRCYQSQFFLGRENERPSFEERMTIQAAYWGHMIGCQYGEPFACREVPGIRDWRAIVELNAEDPGR